MGSKQVKEDLSDFNGKHMLNAVSQVGSSQADFVNLQDLIPRNKGADKRERKHGREGGELRVQSSALILNDTAKVERRHPSFSYLHCIIKYLM